MGGTFHCERHKSHFSDCDSCVSAKMIWLQDRLDAADARCGRLEEAVMDAVEQARQRAKYYTTKEHRMREVLAGDTVFIRQLIGALVDSAKG